MSEPRGPVFVSIPMDGMDDDCPAVEIRKVSYRVAPDPEEIKELAKILSAGKQIALIAGEEIDVAGATGEVVKSRRKIGSSRFSFTAFSHLGISYNP